MSSPAPVSVTCASELPRDLTALVLSYIGPSSDSDAANCVPLESLNLVNNEWHKLTQPRLDQQLEQTMRCTVLWCNTSKPAADAPAARYHVLAFQSFGRDLYLMLDARQENQASLQFIQEALCDSTEGGLNYHCNDDGEQCDRGTVRFKWIRSDETSESLWPNDSDEEAQGEERRAQLQQAAVFSHVDALRKIRELPATNIIVVNGVLDLEKIRATIEKEKEYWAKIKEDPESEFEDDETLGLPGMCAECERRCPPIYWVLTDIHEQLDAEGPIHKPGFVPTYDPKARWVCLYWSYEGNARATYLIDARKANKEALKLLWEKKPVDQWDYPYHWIPSTWGDDEKPADEAQVRKELLSLKAPWGFEPQLTVYRGEVELEALTKYFEKNSSSNSLDAMCDRLKIKPGTEAWPQDEVDEADE